MPLIARYPYPLFSPSPSQLSRSAAPATQGVPSGPGSAARRTRVKTCKSLTLNGPTPARNLVENGQSELVVARWWRNLRINQMPARVRALLLTFPLHRMQSGIVIFLAPSAWFGYLAAFLCLSGMLENTGA